MTSVWKFEQLGGPQKTLVLEDHAAPHGRPRQGPVVTDEIEIREAEVYYTGNDVPTRHIFGTRIPPQDLNGRFSDGYGGRGFATAKAAEVKAFVADAQQVRITWDNLVSEIGLLKNFKPERESDGEVVWSMTLLIDKDNLIGAVPLIPEPLAPLSYVNQILAALKAKDDLGDIPPTLKGDIFDSLNSLISSINSISAELNRAADQINAFAEAPFLALRRFRAGLRQLRTAILKLRRTYDNFKANLALESRNSNDLQRLFTTQALFGASVTRSLIEIAKADRAAALAERGTFKGAYTAKQGDTWESISNQIYGSPDRAGSIRDANGVPAGSAPVPGVTYLIPR